MQSILLLLIQNVHWCQHRQLIRNEILFVLGRQRGALISSFRNVSLIYVAYNDRETLINQKICMTRHK